MTITPGNWNFTIYQGGTFRYVITWKDENNTPINLTGYSAQMQARTSAASATTLLDISTASGGITLGGSAGTITLFLSAAATAALKEGVGVYDLRLTAPGGNPDNDFIIQGNLVVQQMATR